MNTPRKIEIFGDSLLKGIQLNPSNLRYCVDNHIDVDMLSEKYGLSIRNHSKFGCTVTKGRSLIEAFLAKNGDCHAVVLEYGGNDCDFTWSEIADSPSAEHLPHTPIDLFIATYKDIIQSLRHRGIVPILTTLPPLAPQLFFDWFCRGLDKVNVLRWLGDISLIYRHQEFYSAAVMKIAHETGSLLVDLREPFLNSKRIEAVLCEDGTHLNTEGQKLVTGAFAQFAERFA